MHRSCAGLFTPLFTNSHVVLTIWLILLDQQSRCCWFWYSLRAQSELVWFRNRTIFLFIFSSAVLDVWQCPKNQGFVIHGFVYKILEENFIYDYSLQIFWILIITKYLPFGMFWFLNSFTKYSCILKWIGLHKNTLVSCVYTFIWHQLQHLQPGYVLVIQLERTSFERGLCPSFRWNGTKNCAIATLAHAL